MKLYSLALLGLIAAAAPQGCQQAQQDIATAQQIVNSDLPTACALVASANASFLTAAAAGAIPSKDVSIEAQAYAGVASVCANPDAVSNPITALQAIADAYAAVVKARLGQ